MAEDEVGICYTRTGRRFFDEPGLESAVLERVRAAAEAAGLFDELTTDWLLLDCELMPWSAKAQQLLREQYAAVGAAGRVGLGEAIRAVDQAASRDGASALADLYRARLDDVSRYTDAYRRYCWPVESVTGLKLAPFHLLASEKAVHVGRPQAVFVRRLLASNAIGEGDEDRTAGAERAIAEFILSLSVH